MNNLVLVVLVNDDAVHAYPIDEKDLDKIKELRKQVQERVRAEVFAQPGELPQVRLQVVNVDMPGCSPDGFISALAEDILKVST